jgi:hypothetical protein
MTVRAGAGGEAGICCARLWSARNRLYNGAGQLHLP